MPLVAYVCLFKFWVKINHYYWLYFGSHPSICLCALCDDQEPIKIRRILRIGGKFHCLLTHGRFDLRIFSRHIKVSTMQENAAMLRHLNFFFMIS